MQETLRLIDTSKKVSNVKFQIKTGIDNLRSDCMAHAYIYHVNDKGEIIPLGPEPLNKNKDGEYDEWDNYTIHAHIMTMDPPIAIKDFRMFQIIFTSISTWPETGDKWEVETIDITTNTDDHETYNFVNFGTEGSTNVTFKEETPVWTMPVKPQ